jgi:hypothetical protein
MQKEYEKYANSSSFAFDSLSVIPILVTVTARPFCCMKIRKGKLTVRLMDEPLW